MSAPACLRDSTGILMATQSPGVSREGSLVTGSSVSAQAVTGGLARLVFRLQDWQETQGVTRGGERGDIGKSYTALRPIVVNNSLLRVISR